MGLCSFRIVIVSKDLLNISQLFTATPSCIHWRESDSSDKKWMINYTLSKIDTHSSSCFSKEEEENATWRIIIFFSFIQSNQRITTLLMSVTNIKYLLPPQKKQVSNFIGCSITLTNLVYISNLSVYVLK